MSLKVSVLGSNSAIPTLKRHPSAQVVWADQMPYLIDCGEGTQRQMRLNKVGFSKISTIFISHLHGDHFFGLIGLISTFGILNREKELHIHGPKGIKEVINIQLKHSKSYVKFKIIFHELNSTESELIFEDEKVKVYTIPLNHRVYTNGFLFKEKEKSRKINISAVKKFKEIDVCDYNNLKAGKDFKLASGDVIKNSELTCNPEKAVSYAYCSDTSYKPSIIKIINGVDLLYHESTFLTDKEDLATKTGHSTAKQAATIAKKAKVKKLVLGHYSSRYKNISLFKKEAQEVFKNVSLAETGRVFSSK